MDTKCASSPWYTQIYVECTDTVWFICLNINRKLVALLSGSNEFCLSRLAESLLCFPWLLILEVLQARAGVNGSENWKWLGGRRSSYSVGLMKFDTENSSWKVCPGCVSRDIVCWRYTSWWETNLRWSSKHKQNLASWLAYGWLSSYSRSCVPPHVVLWVPVVEGWSFSVSIQRFDCVL